MNVGNFFAAIQAKVKELDGPLFEQAHALPLDLDQLELLIQAADANWRDVEPAIFGSLVGAAASSTIPVRADVTSLRVGARGSGILAGQCARPVRVRSSSLWTVRHASTFVRLRRRKHHRHHAARAGDRRAGQRRAGPPDLPAGPAGAPVGQEGRKRTHSRATGFATLPADGPGHCIVMYEKEPWPAPRPKCPNAWPQRAVRIDPTKGRPPAHPDRYG